MPVDDTNSSITSSRLFTFSRSNTSSLVNLKASSQRYLSTFSAKRLFCRSLPSSYRRSSSETKWVPRRLSSEDVMRIFFPRMKLLISVKNFSQVTSVSRIIVPAKRNSSSSSWNLFLISRIFHLLWNAVSKVNTFWSLVFIVHRMHMLDGMDTL